jgi:integrase
MGAVRRQYGSGSITQRKDGMWIGRFEAGTDRNGRRRRVTVSATTEARCKEKLEDKKRDVARTGAPESGSGKRTTVETWSRQWLDMMVTELRPGPYRTTASTMKVWVVPTIGRKRLDSLTPQDIRAVFDEQRRANLAQSTRIRAHSDIMQMLKAAMLEGHDVPPRVLLVKKPKPGENDREAIPVEDALAILKVVADRPDASLWTALLLQGIRQGERLGLTWDCVDFENETLDISWQLQPLPYIDNRDKALGFRVPDGYVARHLTRSFHLVRPKTKRSRRIIPMVMWMQNALKVWRDAGPESPFGLVWPDENGMPRTAPADREEWKRIQELADVTHPSGRPFVLHEARHTTATLLLDLGIEKDVVEAIMGHSKFIESYDHSDWLPRSRAALEKVAERLALV